jgi:hypothetical protein
VRTRIAAVAARALGHASADVQAAALSLINLTCTDEKERDALLHSYRPVLAASVLAQLESLSAAVSGAATIAAASSDAPMAIAKAERVVPIDDVDQLVEAFAAVLENQGPPVEIERVMDGVARIPNSDRFTASLAKRAEGLLKRADRAQPRAALAELALAWTRSHRTPQPAAEDNLADFLLWRIWCLSEQAAQHQMRPLLSLPTWPDGRIDPAEFARRLREQAPEDADAAAGRTSLFHLDLLQARLRAEPPPKDTLPRLHLSWNVKSWEFESKTYRHHEPILEVLDSRPRSRFDPVILSTAGGRVSLEMLRWCATVCPLWREGWFAGGCRELGDNINWWEANWSTRAYLEPLLDPHTAIGEMGSLLLALGLGAKEAGESMLAVDALIGSLGDGRLSGAALGRALIEAASSGAIKFSRWSKQLARAAEAGPQQAHAIFHALEALFESGGGRESGDYSKIVELARELAHQTKLRLSRPGAIANLHAIPTQGKTKRVIAELMRL